MAEKKKQHYVPQMYLRFFSIDNNNSQIGIYNLTKDLFIEKASLAGQAKENYFYGKDLTLENELGALEGSTTPYLRTIISSNKLPAKGSLDYETVLCFCVILSNRTKDTAEQIKETADKFVDIFAGEDEETRADLETQRANMEKPAAMALSITKERIHLAKDLKCKLIINNTATKFITSDNPVVKYNQFLEQRQFPGGTVGIVSKGLQIYFPISPAHMLFYYDDWVYKVGDKAKDIIEINSEKDVDSLNFLQVMNCTEQLFFNHSVSKTCISRLVDRAKGRLLNEYTNVYKTDSYTDADGFVHDFYHSYNSNIQINLELSFIKQTKRGKNFILAPYSVQLRDENLRKTLRN